MEITKDLLDKCYPVGIICGSLDEAFDPNESLVGTWEIFTTRLADMVEGKRYWRRIA